MTDLALGLVAFLSVAALDFRVTRGNLGSPWNGYGAVRGVWRRTNKAPMRYRPLVAWLIGWLPPGARLPAYLVVKYGLLAGAFVAAYPLIGGAGLVVLALLIATTLDFEYWDCYAELLSVGLVLSGSVWLVAVGALTWGLSKETFPLALPLALFSWGLWCGLAALVAPIVWGLMRLYQGKATLYCGRGEYNASDLRAMFRKGDVVMFTTIAWVVGGVAIMLARRAVMPPALALTAWAPLMWFGASIALARMRETRVIMPAALWIAAGLVGG